MISVNTETRENGRAFQGWVCYDAQCVFCRRRAVRAQDLLARRGWHLAPLQANWVRRKFGLEVGEVPDEMKLLTADGRILGGVDAILLIARSIWWAWPLFALAKLLQAESTLCAGYRLLAKKRYCLGGRCALPPANTNRHRHLTSSFYEIP